MSLSCKLLLWAAMMCFIVAGSKAHEMHLINGRVNYSNWVNKDNKGCCNNQDCRPVPEGFERINNGVLEVFVPGEGVALGQFAWCPVQAHHYLKSGNAPDGSTSHYCVWWNAGSTPCTQLLCYQPSTMF